MAILVFLIILTILVLIHEAGHFIVARRVGIKVEEFGFGLPPRALSIKIGETVYSINWLPIGGFVKLYGEDEAGAGKFKIQNAKFKVKDKERAFFSKTPWERALVVIAGVFMNAVLASVIFYAFLIISNFQTDLPLLNNHKFFGVNQITVSDIVINNVVKDSPADKAGVKPMSKIIAINNQKITNVDYFVSEINKNKGKEILIEWQDIKTNKIFKGEVIPRVSPPKNQGALGISFFPVTMVTLKYETAAQKIFSGITHPINLLSYNFDVIGQLIQVAIKEKDAAPLGNSVTGPVGIYSLVGNIVQIPSLKERVLQVLNLAGILSISLAFFNILPFPALDGGRLFFILIEAVTGKKVPAKFESYAHAIGMAILLTLIAVITFQDLTRLISGNGFLSP